MKSWTSTAVIIDDVVQEIKRYYISSGFITIEIHFQIPQSIKKVKYTQDNAELSIDIFHRILTIILYFIII